MLEFRRKQVVVRDLVTQKLWLIPYTAINLDGVDVKIREADRVGLSRHEVSVGETVGFIDREHRQRHGKIIRLNDKTVTLESGGQSGGFIQLLALGSGQRFVIGQAQPRWGG